MRGQQGTTLLSCLSPLLCLTQGARSSQGVKWMDRVMCSKSSPPPLGTWTLKWEDLAVHPQPKQSTPAPLNIWFAFLKTNHKVQFLGHRAGSVSALNA